MQVAALEQALAQEEERGREKDARIAELQARLARHTVPHRKRER